MGIKKSKVPPGNVPAWTISIKTSDNANVSSQPTRLAVQNFLLIWLDANFDAEDDHFENSLKCLRKIVASITTFTDPQKCIEFLGEIKQEKAFLLVSDSLGREIFLEHFNPGHRGHQTDV